MNFLLTDVDDKELVFAFEEGDKSAFEKIYGKYWVRLFNEAWKVLKDKELARDAVQDVFMSLWSRFGKQTQIQSLSNFLYKSIRNKVLNDLKTLNKGDLLNQYIEKYGLPDFEQIEVDVFKINEEREQLAQKLQERIESAISDLPPKTKAIFELYKKYEFSHKEIAQITGTSPRTIKKQISNALQVIRSKLLFLF